MSRASKHEAALVRCAALLQETEAKVNCPSFFKDAIHVIASLRRAKPKETPLALYFISVAVVELLEGRGDSAKICLLMAQTFAEKRLRAVLLHLFCAAFHRHATCEEHQQAMAVKFSQILQANIGKLMELLEHGGGTIKLSKGCQAQVMPIGSSPVKAAVNKKSAKKILPPVNPWN